MQQFQSLQRLLIFYALTLLVMLSIYYFALFHEIKKHSEQHSIDTFHTLQYEVTERDDLLNPDIKRILEKPVFEDISYQLVFMMPSGQTYIHRHTQPNERAFANVTFPIISSSPSNNGSHSAYTLNNRNLTGTIKLKSGHQLYIILRHKPLIIDWISYRYWLPLMAAIMLFIIALLYMLNRRTNWEQLLIYTDNLSSHAKEAYSPPPFLQKKSTPEFLRLGHALSRVSYQLHNDYRRIKTLTHRLERLVDQSPLPMLMIMRHGQISFFNKRFEQIFMSLPQSDSNYELTDFIAGKDESTQRLLQTLSNLRVTRTLTVYGLENEQTYQLHVTPWFGEHGQVHGFTVLLNNVNEFASQIGQLQQQNQRLQRQINEFNTITSTSNWKKEGVAWYSQEGVKPSNFPTQAILDQSKKNIQKRKDDAKKPKGRPYYYSQLDPRWSNNRFNASTIGPAGCVPTSLAEVLKGCYGMNLTPADVAARMDGYSNQAFGASGRDLIQTANSYGHQVEVVTSEARAKQLLSDGYPLIWFVNVGIGHAVATFGNSNGNTEMYDPYNHMYFNGWYSISRLWSIPSNDSVDWNAGRPVFAIK